MLATSGEADFLHIGLRMNTDAATQTAATTSTTSHASHVDVPDPAVVVTIGVQEVPPPGVLEHDCELVLLPPNEMRDDASTKKTTHCTTTTTTLTARSTFRTGKACHLQVSPAHELAWRNLRCRAERPRTPGRWGTSRAPMF